MAILAEVTANGRINDHHLRDNEYIQFGGQQWPKYPKYCHLYFAKTDTPCSAVSLRQLSYLLRAYAHYMMT